MTIHYAFTMYRMWRDLRGATAIEYGLIAALVAIAAVSVMGTVGTKIRNTFTNVSNNLRVG